VVRGPQFEKRCPMGMNEAMGIMDPDCVLLNISIMEHIRQHTVGVIDMFCYAIGPKVLETTAWTLALLLTEDTNTCSIFNIIFS